jgi:outer membrane protein OmpA-like peptidoglycan-associated protein
MSMFSGIRLPTASSDEAEKPFWISYADLMTSLMVLFLLVMLASLVSLTRTVTDLQDTRSRSELLAARYKTLKANEAETRHKQAVRRTDIATFWDRLEQRTRGLGVRVDRNASLINFGSRARFQTASDRLSSSDQFLLRRFAPELLSVADSDLGRRVLNRVVVEGYADRRGSYLFNLNLSSNRSQRVLCSLLGPGGRAHLDESQKRRVRDLFLVGGFSYNRSRRSLAASRRIEIRVDFLPLGGRRAPTPRGNTSFGACSLAP